MGPDVSIDVIETVLQEGEAVLVRLVFLLNLASYKTYCIIRSARLSLIIYGRSSNKSNETASSKDIVIIISSLYWYLRPRFSVSACCH
jgi:hypothetical protein